MTKTFGPLTANTTYELSAWVAGANFQTADHAMVLFAGDTPLAAGACGTTTYAGPVQANFPATANWSQRTLTYATGPGAPPAGDLTVRFYAGGGTFLCIDDVQLTAKAIR